MNDEIPIGPNRCVACGGEYGEHAEDCSLPGLSQPRKVRMKPGRKKGWRKKRPESLTENVQQVQAAISAITKVFHDELQPNDVIQIHAGDLRGVLAQVGLVRDGTIYGYQILQDGERRKVEAKVEDATRIGKGKCAWKYEEESETPDWHEGRPLPQ